MPKFDVDTAVESMGQGSNILESAANGFGAPACLTNLLEDALSLIPFPILMDMHNKAEEAQETIDAWMDEHLSDINLGLGISVTITPNGEIQFSSRNSKFGMGIPGMNALGTIAGFANGILNMGANLYAQGQAIGREFEAMKACIKGYFDNEKFKGTKLYIKR